MSHKRKKKGDQNEIRENELQPQKSLEIPNLVWRDTAETHSHRHTWASHKSAICSPRRSDWDGSWTPANTDQWAKKTNQTESRCVCTLAVLRESYLINDVTETGQRRKDAGANSAFVYILQRVHTRETHAGSVRAVLSPGKESTPLTVSPYLFSLICFMGIPHDCSSYYPAFSLVKG